MAPVMRFPTCRVGLGKNHHRFIAAYAHVERDQPIREGSGHYAILAISIHTMAFAPSPTDHAGSRASTAGVAEIAAKVRKSVATSGDLGPEVGAPFGSLDPDCPLQLHRHFGRDIPCLLRLVDRGLRAADALCELGFGTCDLDRAKERAVSVHGPLDYNFCFRLARTKVVATGLTTPVMTLPWKSGI